MRIFTTVVTCAIASIALPATAATCAFELPALPVFEEHPANYGRLRTAHDLWSKLEAVKAEDCGCPYSKPFSAFTSVLSGREPTDLRQADVDAIHSWRLAEGGEILERHMAFAAQVCREK